MTTFTREDFAHAARAAGKHSVEWADPGQINDKGGLVQYIGLGRVETWNPRDDDGDALRLAVKAGIAFRYERNAPPELHLPRECAIAITGNGRYFSDVAKDEMTATRHAIFRAAIAIGKAMPPPATDTPTT